LVDVFFQLRRIKSCVKALPSDAAKAVVNSFVVSRIDYCNCLFIGATQYQLDRLQAVLNAAARLLFGVGKFDRIRHIIRDRLHWLPVPRRIQFKVCLLTYNAVHGLGPRYLSDELHSVAAVQARKRLRSSTRDDLVVTAANSKFGKKSFFFTVPRLWNRLPLTVRRKGSADSFKMALKTFLHSDAADVFDT